MARMLGQLIKDSDEMKRMNEAEEKYNADPGLQALISEYNAHNAALESTDDESFTEAIEKRMKEIYDAVAGNPVYTEYIAAQKEVQQLMNSVNSEINFIVTGERGCGGSCDCCSGCH